MVETTSAKRGLRKTRNGTVISRSGDKTIVIQVETRKPHPLYGKILRTQTKLHVHDEKNEASVGDRVEVVQCRPMSRLKRWRLLAITEAR